MQKKSFSVNGDTKSEPKFQKKETLEEEIKVTKKMSRQMRESSAASSSSSSSREERFHSTSSSKRVPMKMGDFSVIDSEFDNIR